MRLTLQEILSIKNSFNQVFNGGKIYLFSSRVNDDLKGGDINLYIELDKILITDELSNTISEQKIDVLVSNDKSRLINKEALAKGILRWMMYWY